MTFLPAPFHNCVPHTAAYTRCVLRSAVRRKKDLEARIAWLFACMIFDACFPTPPRLAGRACPCVSGYICVEGTCLTAAPPPTDSGGVSDASGDSGEIDICVAATAPVCDDGYLRFCFAAHEERTALCPSGACAEGLCSLARPTTNADALAFARVSLVFPAASETGLTYYIANSDTGSILGYRDDTDLTQPSTLRAAGTGHNTVGGLLNIYFNTADAANGMAARSFFVFENLSIPRDVRVRMVGRRAISLLSIGRIDVLGELRADGGYGENGAVARRESGPGGGRGGLGGNTTEMADGIGAGGGKACRGTDAGGGGGSFATRGGNGGSVVSVDVSAGPTVMLPPAISGWIGGSGGAGGGAGATGALGGDGGGGGGLLHIFALGPLVVNGVVSASGAGGGGGRSAVAGVDASAGGGGGSGGLIVFEAPIVAGNGQIRVMGGAGGQGGHAGVGDGVAGANGGVSSARALGIRWPTPADTRGGGGAGSDADGAAERGQNGVADGEKGGGGGGGAGRVAMNIIGDSSVRVPDTAPNSLVCRTLGDLLSDNN